MHSKTTNPEQETPWWPRRALERHPISRVHVCTRSAHTPPPLAHVVNLPRLEVVVSGLYLNRIETGIEAGELRLRPGDVLYAPPNAWNLPCWRQRGSVLSVLWGRRQVGVSLVQGEGQESALQVQKRAFPRPTGGLLPSLFDALQHAAADRTAAPTLVPICQAIVAGVARELEATQTQARQTDSRFEAICLHVQNEYAHAITRDSAAAHFGISPTHLSRLFRQEGLMTFSSYLNHVRIDRAKHLLRNYELKLEDVSARCGFSDASYFCRVFRQLVHTSPAKYRRG